MHHYTLILIGGNHHAGSNSRKCSRLEILDRKSKVIQPVENVYYVSNKEA